jgi:hypothetical protein
MFLKGVSSILPVNQWPDCSSKVLSDADVNCDDKVNITDLLLVINLTLHCSAPDQCTGPAFSTVLDANQNNIIDHCGF